MEKNLLIELLETGEKVSLYSPRFEGEEYTEFEKFLLTYKDRYAQDVQILIRMVDIIKENKLPLIIDCGVDDFFIDVNRELHQKMLALKIDHDYIERPGKHNIDYWENSLKFQLLFFYNFFHCSPTKRL